MTIDRLPELLSRVVANPADPEARAVYADALIEAGDPRGELIQVELALARIGIETMDDLVFSPLEGAALAHATQLLQRAIALRPDTIRVRRGFTTTAQSSDLDELARTMATSPIETLVPESSIPIAKLLGLPLARIRTFYLRPAKDLENLPALFAAMPQLESVVALCPFDVAALEPCTRLRSFAGSQLDLDRLSRLPCRQTLAVLRTSRTPAAFRSAELLPALERLEIDDAIEPVAERLPRELVLGRIVRPDRLAILPAMSSVEALEIASPELPEDAMFSIVTSRNLHAVTKLALRGPASERAFRGLIHKGGARLEWLSLEKAPLPGRVVAAIVGAHRLVHLHWSPLGGSPESAELANEPACATLRSLSIFGAYLGDDGVATLAASPHLANLRRLHLGKNVIYARGRVALAESPHLRGVVDLDLRWNGDTAYLVLASERVTEDVLREVLEAHFDLDRRGGLAGGIKIEQDAQHVAAHARLAGVDGCTQMVWIPRAKAYDALPIAQAIRDRVGGVLFDTSTETRV